MMEIWPRQRHQESLLVHSDSIVSALFDYLIGRYLREFKILSHRSSMSFTRLKRLALLLLVLNVRTDINENPWSSSTEPSARNPWSSSTRQRESEPCSQLPPVAVHAVVSWRGPSARVAAPTRPPPAFCRGIRRGSCPGLSL